MPVSILLAMVFLAPGDCAVFMTEFFSLKYPPGFGLRWRLFISMWTIFMNSICAASFWISSCEEYGVQVSESESVLWRERMY